MLRIGLIGRLMIAAGVAGLVVGLVGTFAVNRYATKALRERVEESNRGLVERLAVGFDDRTLRTVNALKREAQGEDLATQSRARATTALASALRAPSEYAVLSLHDRSGTAVASAAARFLADPATVETRKGVVDGLRAAGSTVRVTNGPLPTLEIAVSVESPPGTIIGALVGEIPLEVMANTIASFRVGNTGTASLLDSDGRTLVHQDRGRVVRAHRIDIAPMGAERVSGYTAIDPRSGEETLISVARTRVFPGVIAIEQTLADATQPVSEARQIFILIVLLSVLATAGAISVAGRRVLAPMRPLTAAVREFGAGDVSARAPDRKRGDEIGLLSAQFNGMADALDARMSELAASERRSTEAQQRLDDAFANAPIGMAMLSLEGRIERVNQALVDLFGYPEEGLLQRSFADMTHPADAATLPRDRMSSGETDTQGAERRYVRADGNTIWALSHVARVSDASGVPVQLFAQVQDITTRKTAEEELRRIDRAKSEFVANAAHELRTPLTAIVGFAELLSMRTALSPKDLDDVCAGLQRQGTRVRILVERMLDLLRIESGSPASLQPLSAAAVIRRALVATPAPDDRTVEVDVDPGIEVVADHVALEQVVSNLLTNAYRYGGSSVAIRGQHQGDDVVEIMIEDNGLGVSGPAAEHLFEPFNRGTDATGPGSGLGLAIVRRLMASMEGTIRYEQRSPTGARFVLQLRRHRGSSSPG